MRETLTAATGAGGGDRREASAPDPTLAPRLVAGESVVVVMTEARGASNAKARRELAWAPRYASWRQGFVASYRRATRPVAAAA